MLAVRVGTTVDLPNNDRVFHNVFSFRDGKRFDLGLYPVGAVRQIWEKTGWKTHDVDLYELNEAFSVQALAVMRELELNPDKVNVNGGAVAIGHPIGASGARILVTLIHEMIRRNVHRGIAALCLGGGNAVAMAVER